MNSVFIIPIILVLFGTLWLSQEQRISALEAHQECLIYWLDQSSNQGAGVDAPVGWTVNTGYAYVRDHDNQYDYAEYMPLFYLSNDLYHGRISEMDYRYSVADHQHSLDFVRVASEREGYDWEYKINTLDCSKW